MNKKIKAKYEDGSFKPNEPIDIESGKEVDIIVIEDTDGSIKTNDLMKLSEKNESFDFLNNPEEDIYSLEDIKKKFN